MITANLHRRHLNESQRSMVAARIANVKHGGDRKTDQRANLPFEISNGQAAEKLNVSERLVKTAKTVQSKAIPELIDKVEAGLMWSILIPLHWLASFGTAAGYGC